MTLIPVEKVLMELSQEMMDTIVDLRHEGYDIPEITHKTGVTLDQVRYAIRRQMYEQREPGPDDIIDGERLDERIKRITNEIKQRVWNGECEGLLRRKRHNMTHVGAIKKRG